MTSNEDDGRLPQLDQLPMTRMPERDLWPGIEARLTRRRPRIWLPFALAASLVVAVTAGVWQQSRGPDGAYVQPAPATVAVATATADPARQVFPQQQALLKANLAIVRDAERQLQHALEQDPQSESLQRLLQTMQDRRGALKTRLHST